MNFKSIMVTITLLITATAAYGSEKQTKALCLNSLYNKLTQPKTDVDCFFKKERKAHLGGLVSWEYDVLKDDVQLHKIPYENRRVDEQSDSFHKLIESDGVSKESIEKKLNPTRIKRALNLISSTIKSDLGFDPKSNEGVPPVSFNRTTLLAQFGAAGRLHAYDSIASMLSVLLFSSVTKYAKIDTSSLSSTSQFPATETSSWKFQASSILLTPLAEEGIFTDIIPSALSRTGEKYLGSTGGKWLGRIVSPLLFGLMHHHSDPLRWAVQAIAAAQMSYLHASYFQNNPGNLLVPMLAHAMSNARALYLLSRKSK